MRAAHAMQPPAHAHAPPVQRRPAAVEESTERPQRLLTSLASIPAVRRKGTDGAAEDEERQITVSPKLEVGPVDDPYEREADGIGGQVMAMRQSTIQRIDNSEEDTDTGVIRRRRNATPSVQRNIDEAEETPEDLVQARRSDVGTPSANRLGNSSLDSLLDKPESDEDRPLSAPASIQRTCITCYDDTPVMPRLEVGPVDDPYEREADGIAGRVMAMRDPISHHSDNASDDMILPRREPASVQRTPAPLLESDPLRDPDEMPRMKPYATTARTEHIAASATQLTRGGSELSGATRDFFESRMGRDLSQVRVHTGTEGSALNASIRARAFTYKNHVWLRASERIGPTFTLAHELAHVLQQTAPGPVGPQAWRRKVANSEASDSDALVQRKENAFWLPDKTISAKSLHKAMHDRAIEEIGKAHTEILSEVPIPGANRKLVDVGAKGRADIYTATANPDVMVPGINEVVAATPTSSNTGDTDQGPITPSPPAGNAPTTVAPSANIASLANFSPTMIEPMKQGRTKIAHDGRRAPKIDAGKLKDIGFAPTNIRIGEMKPYHDIDYRNSGAKQIANYIAGITSVANTVNSVVKAAGQNQQWKPNAKVIDGTSLIPSGWDARVAHTDWPFPSIKIRHYKPTRTRKKSGKAKLKAKDTRQGRPKSQPIRGRWMMAPDNDPGHEGVFVYFLAPNPTDLATALGPTSTRTEFRRLSAKLEKIKHDLIASPKPVASGVKVQPRRLPAKSPLRQASAVPVRPVRKEVKDNFKASEWEKARTGAGLGKGEKDTSLLGDYTSAADNDLREDIAEKGAMVEWLKTKPATKGTTYTEKIEYDTLFGDLKLLKKVDFWTGIKARPFGILREKFGLFFVKAYQKAVGFAHKIREKFKSFNESKILAGKKGTIVKAAAKVASVVLPRLAKPFLAKMFDTIIQCGITGFEAKFRELIEGTFIEDVIETAEQLKGKVETLATNVEAYFKGLIKKMVDPIAKEFEQFVSEAKLVMDVVSMVKEITKAIRIGSCVAGLASAPETVGIGAVVGCGAALGDYILSKFGLSPVDHLIGTILSSCDMQNKLGKLMAGIEFIKTLPKRAGKAIITEVKTLLKDSDTLKGLGSFKGKDFGQHASELFCNPDSLQFPEMGYEKSDCSNTGSYRKSKTGSYDIPDNIPPLYKEQKPIPSSEKPWKGREIPAGRKGELEPIPDDKGKTSTAEQPTKKPPQKDTAGAGSGDTATTGSRKTKFDITIEKVPKVIQTPKEFRAMFIHGVESGFRTDRSGNFDEKTAGGCYSKTVKLSILDIYGFHEDNRKVAVKICKLEKIADAPYPNISNKVWFEPDADVLMVVTNEAGNPLVSYALRGGKRYKAWLAQRKRD